MKSSGGFIEVLNLHVSSHHIAGDCLKPYPCLSPPPSSLLKADPGVLSAPPGLPALDPETAPHGLQTLWNTLGKRPCKNHAQQSATELMTATNGAFMETVPKLFSLRKRALKWLAGLSSVELCEYKMVKEMNKHVDACTSLPDFSSSSLSLLLMKQSWRFFWLLNL